ncbi:MAG TPA: outer membrane beta-barrel protein [Nitrospirota bacterium]|nr:outer membrane beta-barrel protein [Nitrospirota bacterium]
MKRVLIVIMAALLLIACSGQARAEDGTGVSVGIKMWLNQWTQERPGFPSITSDTTLLLGPALEAKYQDQFFVEASYLVTPSDYTFSDVNPSFNVDREDIDAAVGYLVVPQFGILAGYRNTTLKESDTGTKDTLYGPVIGIVGNAFVTPQLSFFGRLEYLITKFKEEDAPGTFQEDSPGWMMEVGVKYAYTRVFAGSLGYRFETNEGNTSNVRDSFSGVTFSGMFSF